MAEFVSLSKSLTNNSRTSDADDELGNRVVASVLKLVRERVQVDVVATAYNFDDQCDRRLQRFRGEKNWNVPR